VARGLLYSPPMSASLASDLRCPCAPSPSLRPRPQLSVVSSEPAPVAPAALSTLPLPRTPLDGYDFTALLAPLRRRALRWCRNAAQADDLVQETLLRAFTKGGVFETQAHLQAWLYKVLQNLFISRRRNEATARRVLDVVHGAQTDRVARWEAPSPAFLLPSAERALGSVPEPFASVVRLVDLEEHSYAEAADVLGVPLGTVMSRLSRGRQRLAQALGRSPRTRSATTARLESGGNPWPLKPTLPTPR
jgi:RNA polymerase sigma-70 factor, ECF subfamily